MQAIDKSLPNLRLNVQPQSYQLIRLPAGSPIPVELFKKPSDFVSITQNSQELSIVVSTDSQEGDELQDVLPSSTPGLEKEGPWRCVKVAGPMILTLTGILNELTIPLREAAIAIFAISTWDTDWVLIKEDKIAAAVAALRAAGWTVDF